MTVENELVRSVLIPEIVRILSSYYNVSPSEIMMKFYESKVGALLADESSGLYGQSPLRIAGLFIMEIDGKIDWNKLG